MQKNFVDANALLLQIGVFYLTWGMLAYVLTLGKSSSTSRNWIFTGQIVMLVVEISLVLQEVKLPDWFLPTVTEHEIVWLMHNLFPAFMNGCRSIGSFYYVDVDELTRTTLLGIRASHTVSPEPLLPFSFVLWLTLFNTRLLYSLRRSWSISNQFKIRWTPVGSQENQRRSGHYRKRLKGFLLKQVRWGSFLRTRANRSRVAWGFTS